MECNHDCNNCNEKCDERTHQSFLEKPNKYSSVKKVIGVVSGKGGVGKSMVTSLLAVTLAQNGYKVGILDADITGPSIPHAFGINKPLEGNKFGTLPQVSKGGIKVVSTNLLLENETEPVVWRGPIIANLVKQFWTDVVWNDIDFLLVDMPPGTSDVPLTVFQSLPISGIVVVTSPQDLVSMIVQKAVKMAKLMNVEILGIVENMSYIMCPDCGKKISIFGESKVDKIAEQYQLNVLGKLPIDPTLTKMVDQGKIEDYSKNYLEKAVEIFENLPVQVVNIAIPVNEDETINHHFGKSNKFIIYTCINQMVITKHLLQVSALGHENVVNELLSYGVNVFLGYNAGNTAKSLLDEHNINHVFGLDGQADDIVLKYLYNELEQKNQDISCDCCDSHDHCGCGSSHSCDGNCSCH